MIDADGEALLDGAAILARVGEIDPVLRKHADEAEGARRLSKSAVDALRWAGVFRMAMPRACGGPEVDICTQVAIVERVARADASAAWCTMIGSESGFFAGYLQEESARRLYPDLDAVTAGFPAPAGTVEICEGGYRLSGRWSFGSGVTHADVIMGGAIVTQNGKPTTAQSGRPEVRMAMLPASQWQILDTWNPDGLAGSGSHDCVIDDVFVPAEYTLRPGQRQRSEPLYCWYGLLVCRGVGVPLGVAAEAFDTARELLAAKKSKALMSPATEEYTVRVGLAQVGAMIGSARSYVYQTLGDLFTSVQNGDEPSLDQRARWAGCVVYAGTTCRDAVQLLVDIVGSAAIPRSTLLNRQLRDLNVIAQHGLTQKRVWEWAGGLYFGSLPPVGVY